MENNNLEENKTDESMKVIENRKSNILILTLIIIIMMLLIILVLICNGKNDTDIVKKKDNKVEKNNKIEEKNKEQESNNGTKILETEDEEGICEKAYDCIKLKSILEGSICENFDCNTVYSCKIDNEKEVFCNENIINKDNIITNKEEKKYEKEVQLISNYWEATVGEKKFISNLSKAYVGLAIRNIKPKKLSKEEVISKNILSESEASDAMMYGSEFEIYSYAEVQKEYQKLFGKDKNVAKEMFMSSNSNAFGYEYIESIDSFINIGSRGGGTGPLIEHYYNINKSYEKDDELHILVEGITFSPNINDYEYKEYSNELTIDEKNTYEYIFKKENNNYYLSNIKEINERN